MMIGLNIWVGGVFLLIRPIVFVFGIIVEQSVSRWYDYLQMAMEKKVLAGKNFGMDGTKIKANTSLTETKTVEEVCAELATINGDIKACYKLISEQLVHTLEINHLLNGVTADDQTDALGFLYVELLSLLQFKNA